MLKGARVTAAFHVAWLACVGCGRANEPSVAPWRPPDVDLAGAEQVSGTRLQIVTGISVDGPPLRTNGFFDTELNTECVFARLDDGSLRCIPNSTLTQSSGSPMFADAACTVPAFQVGNSGATIIDTSDPATCEADSLHAFGEHVDQVWWGSACGTQEIQPSAPASTLRTTLPTASQST